MTPPPRRPDDDLPPLPPLPPLPVAEPVGPDDLDDLPVAVPVRPPAGPFGSKEAGRRDSLSFPRVAAEAPDPDEEAPSRPRVLGACALLGCLGVGVLIAVGFLAYGAIVILNHFNERIADPDRPAAAWSRPGPVEPTQLATPSATVQVGGTFDAAGRAGGGRYLLFRLTGRPARLVAFDANSGAMVPGFEVRLAEPNCLFAGGASKLWVYKPEAREVVRVDLPTGRIEQRAEVPKEVKDVDGMAVGAGSDGPVYLVAGNPDRTDIWLIDGAGLTRAGFVSFRDGIGDAARVRASDDGKLLAVSGPSGAAVVRAGPAGELVFTRLKAADGDPPLLATPAPDGRFVYTPRGVFTPDGEQALPPGGDFFYTFPAAHGGGWFLSLGVDAGGVLTGPPKVHPAGSRAVAATLTQVKVPRPLGVADAGDITPDQRVHFWPAAGLVAVLPTDNKTIDLRKVDVPPAKAGRGE